MSGPPSAPSGSQSARHADEASMRGIIVLESARSKIKSRRKPRDPVAETSKPAENIDPEVFRKIVRRQAALASADKRRATIAASRLKQQTSRRYNDDVRSENVRDDNESATTAMVSYRTPAGFVFDMGRDQIDTFSVLPIDFDSFGHPNTLHMLFSYIVKIASPLMDLRLPMIYDKHLNEKPKWEREMPAQALQSRPAFWSVMAGAATAVALDHGRHPSTDTLTLKLRQMAIQAVNSEIGKFRNSEPDLAILGAVSVLGVWERTWGSDEAWQAHRRGMKALSAYLCKGGPQNTLYAQVLSFADQDGTPVAVIRSPRSDEDAIQELGLGFRSLQKKVFLDNNLVNALVSCWTAEELEFGTEKDQVVHEVALEIGRYSSSVSFTEIAHRDPKRDREGDRILLQLHLLLQSAGISMIKSLEPDLPAISMIDIPAMFKTAAESGKSVATAKMYDEILFWATVTIWALNRDADEEGIEIIRVLAQRLDLQKGPYDAWENALGRFVFLESAREDYERLWYRVMLFHDQQTLLNPEEQGVEYNCQTQ